MIGPPRVSIIVTAYEEGEAIVGYLDRLLESVTFPCEALVVYDSPDDSTAPWVDDYPARPPGSAHPQHLRSGTGEGSANRVRTCQSGRGCSDDG